MCGVAGYWAGGDKFRGDIADEILTHMSDALIHRGPDSSDNWSDPKSGVALAQRRLAIIDLSDAGTQPMHSASGRYVITYNGEIYNFEVLRAELEQSGNAHSWRGHSDTEVLLAAIEAWGLEKALQKSFGMFAIALWDHKKQTLSIARDRLGEKPLYYCKSKDNLLFASELKALIRFPTFEPILDQKAVSAYLQLSYVPAQTSIYKGVHKLAPGTIAEFSNAVAEPEVISYWKLSNITETQRREVGDISYEGAVNELEDILSEVVSSQMLSDVPLGSFLSGGIDSSLVTAIMQANSNAPINTFSIGFSNNQFNESEHARQVANHLGTNHTEFMVSERDALDVIPDLPQIYDEPFADSSQIPTVLLSRLAKEKVTVALTGDGGDEGFGGYNRHIFGPALWNKISKTPQFLKSAIATSAFASQGLVTKSDGLFASVFAKLGLPVTMVNKLSKFALLAKMSKSFEDFYIKTVSTWPAQYELFDEVQLHSIFDAFKFDALGNSASHIMALDAMTYLPNDILVKVDRASMSASLETRAPLLDVRIFEFAWRLPEQYLIKDKSGKRVLKSLLYKHVPKDIIDRPKQGFAIPLDTWLRGELREWADAGISEYCAHQCEDEEAQTLKAIWGDHQSGSQNNSSAIWSVLMLNCWINSNSVNDISLHQRKRELNRS